MPHHFKDLCFTMGKRRALLVALTASAYMHGCQLQLKMPACARIALQVAQGMKYLHSRNVVHFDLKAENLLCDLRHVDAPVVKIGTGVSWQLPPPPL